MQKDLFAANTDFHGDLVRNIPGIRRSQNLFDDLSADPVDWDVAFAAEGTQRIPTAAALITRPFDYASVIDIVPPVKRIEITGGATGQRRNGAKGPLAGRASNRLRPRALAPWR